MAIIQAIVGPYRDHRLEVASADAVAAVAAKWAFDPFAEPPPAYPPELTAAELGSAITAAIAWAQAQWTAAQAPP